MYIMQLTHYMHVCGTYLYIPTLIDVHGAHTQIQTHTTQLQ